MKILWHCNVALCWSFGCILIIFIVGPQLLDARVKPREVEGHMTHLRSGLEARFSSALSSWRELVQEQQSARSQGSTALSHAQVNLCLYQTAYNICGMQQPLWTQILTAAQDCELLQHILLCRTRGYLLYNISTQVELLYSK